MPHHNFDPAEALANEEISRLFMTEAEKKEYEHRKARTAEEMEKLHAATLELGPGMENPSEAPGFFRALKDAGS